MSKDHHRREEDASTVMTICKQLHLLLPTAGTRTHAQEVRIKQKVLEAESSRSLMDGAVQMQGAQAL